MDFTFNHRKLISDYLRDSLIPDCDVYCDPDKNPTGVCSQSCLPICSQNCYISIESGFPGPPDHSNKPKNLSLPLTVSLCIISTLFFLVLVFTIYKIYTCWHRSTSSRSQSDNQDVFDDFVDENQEFVVDHPIWFIRTIGLQPSVISAITVCKYKRGDGLLEGTECAVCLSEFQEDETLRLLPKCNHAFHLPCIDTWLRSHTNCPMCRAGIVINSTPEQSSTYDSGLSEETPVGISENSSELGREREDEALDMRVGMEEELEPGDTQCTSLSSIGILGRADGASQEEGGLMVENEMRIGESSNGNVGNSDPLEGDEVQPVRRSVSVDSLTASMNRLAIANTSFDSKLVKPNESNMGIVPKRINVNQSLGRLVGSSSIGRSLQKGPTLMKRSFSYSGKVLLSRYSRGQKRIVSS